MVASEIPVPYFVGDMADNARRADDECLRASRGCGGEKRMMGMAQGQVRASHVHRMTMVKPRTAVSIFGLILYFHR